MGASEDDGVFVPAGDEDLTGMVPDPVLDRLDKMSGTLSKVADRLETVSGRERRTRQLSWALAVSFFLDIALTVVVTVLTISAIHQGSTLHTSQLAACAISNQTRADERTLWGYLIAVSSESPHANKAELKTFQSFVDKTFAPLNCTQLYGN